MTPFARFFRKAAPPPVPTLDERIATLDRAPADLILETALGADEAALRVAAVGKLADGEALRGLAGLSAATGAPGTVPAGLERAAQTRVAELVESGAIDFTRMCTSSGNHAALLAVAAQCADSGRLKLALSFIHDPAHIARLVVEAPSSRIRQLAAEGIEDPAQLRQLLKQVREKDKSVYKILKQKCDALNAKERQEAQLAAEIGAVSTSLEAHSHRAYDAHYDSTLQQLKVRWNSLGARPPADIDRRAMDAVDRCQEIMAAHHREAARLAAQREAERAALQAAADIRERERQAALEAAAALADAELRRRNQEAAVREAQEAERAQKLEAEARLLGQIGGLIRQARGALEEGHTQRAAGLRRAIEEKLPNAPAMSAQLTRSLQQLDDRLKELKQWKDYAVAPKRVELIEQMEALIGSTDEPRMLADRIKTLQDEWRTTAKGIASDAPEEWERFHRASQSAYQPCKEYFEAQASLRHQNLENRKKILERLAAFEASQNVEQPDWRLMMNVLREAPLEWRRNQPVDREPGRAVQQDFDAAIQRLQAKLGGWHAGNVQDKQALIKRARHLLNQEDGREAIEALKRLQTAWKETGQAPRDLEQSLWNEFREVCDAVYQKRQQAYAAHAAGLEAGKAKAVALCEQAERSADLTGAALLEAAEGIPEWRAAFDALGELPKADARNLKVRFERALNLCRTRLAEQHARDTAESFTNLLEAGRHVSAYEWSLMEGADPARRETLQQAARTFIESVARWPRGGLQTVKDALAKAESSPGADAGGREKALRILCIRGEIECDLSSPAQDETLRREYQVQRLMQGMGQGIHSIDGDWDARGLEWIRIGAVSPLLHGALQERFLRCWSMRRV